MKIYFHLSSALDKLKQESHNRFILIFLFASLFTFAQEFTISGKVYDESGEPISSANVLVKGTEKGTVTNLDGLYQLKLERGQYTLIFSFMGQPIERSFYLYADKTLDVKIGQEPELLDEVLVKAVRVEATSPITHSNLEKEEIKKRNLGQDIPILMNYMPSVVTTSDAGAGIGYTGIRVRGVSAQSTNITINGIPFNDQESLGTFWVNLPDFSSSVENLQLQRGVGTSTNGSGAFGASINVLTDAVSNEANGEISNSFGSFNTRKHTLKFSTGLLNNHIEIAGRLSQIKSDGYVDRATADLKSYFLQGAYVDDNTLIKAIVFGGHENTYLAWNGIEDLDVLDNNRTFNPSGMYTDANGNTQFYDNEVDDYKQDHYQLHWNERITNNWSTNIGLNYTYGRGYYEQFKEDESFSDYGLSEITIGNTVIDETDLIRRKWLDNDFYVANASVNYKENNLNITAGGSYSNYDGDHFGEVIWAQFLGDNPNKHRYYDGNGKKTDLSFFSKATYKLNENISLFGDLQLRLLNYKTTGLNSDRTELILDKNYSFFNPKAGITYLLNEDNSLYFSYARANREPNKDDFEANSDVKPEQLNDFELGWRYNTEKIKVNSNLYYMLYNEQLVLTGALDDVGSPIRANSGKSYRLGLEVDAQVQIGNQFAIQPAITLSSNKNIDYTTQLDGELVNLGKTNISFSPEVVASNAFVYKPLNNLQFSLLSKYVGEQYMGNTDSERSKLDSYFVSDLNVFYEIKPKSIFKSIVISALVNNIFNKKYISNGFYYTYDDTWSVPNETTTIEGAGYYPQATANFLVGVTLNF
ncbi:TonB-dependent receptor [Aureibaculum sp. 2210JD6-5]|uniref:TonB-dependent receptor n=1 Tax=Aureibaculum sp. 2210JD6-5 TaxID=3103957 RepID=UPI002AAC9A96|nr:TonB-dependent receptor [Aureibaculum sp. 2210JD6-5]MDY7395676.1 TonB-dependent receptor [Aureibaculum sp. 2210JD6-5]